MNNIKQNYDSAVEKIKEMEEIIKHKTELLQEEEKKVGNLSIKLFNWPNKENPSIIFS